MADHSNRENVVLITGGAGFIGFSLSRRLLEQGYLVVGLDNLSDYYDVNLKKARLKLLDANERYLLEKGDLQNHMFVNKVFQKHLPSFVINLGGQAGVRYSIENPRAYLESNIVGFFNILEACKKYNVQHLIFASSSSVYGLNRKVPYSVGDQTDAPISFYAATKKSDELMAHAYSKIYDIPCTGLRFFTVYGPWGRPDMAYYKFTKKMIAGEAIQIYNNGNMFRDFTYIDDIVTGIEKVLKKYPDFSEDGARFKVYNIGNSKPESLLYFVETLERCLIKEKLISAPAKKEFLPMQSGDVYQTYADVDELITDFGFSPSTTLEDGLTRFVAWYKDFYNIDT